MLFVCVHVSNINKLWYFYMYMLFYSDNIRETNKTKLLNVTLIIKGNNAARKMTINTKIKYGGNNNG